LPAFKDYHKSKGTEYVDWHAALKYWLRNGHQMRKKGPGYGQPPVTGSLTENYQRQIARYK